TNGHIESVGPEALGTPLYLRRSRMSDAKRFFPDEAAAERCRRHVADHGGVRFFDRPGWRRELAALSRDPGGRFENDADRASAIRDELADGRALLNERLRTTTVKHVALP